MKQYKYKSKKIYIYIYTNFHPMRVYGCVFKFCSVTLLFVYLRMHMSSNPRFIAGVLFELVGSLRTTGQAYYCAPLVCVPAVIEVLAVWLNYKPKTKNAQEAYRGWNPLCDRVVSGPGRCHGLLMHTWNCINVPCGTVRARPAVRAGTLVRAVFKHL